jgi:hypothetical protein
VSLTPTLFVLLVRAPDLRPWLAPWLPLGLADLMGYC